MIIRAVHNPNSGIRLIPGRVMQRADDTVHGSPWLILHTPVEGGQIVKHPGGGILSMKETKNTYRRKIKKIYTKIAALFVLSHPHPQETLVYSVANLIHAMTQFMN